MWDVREDGNPKFGGGRHLALVVLALVVLGGCANVAPYERETLARRDMQLQRNPDASAGELHSNAYREGSAGGEGSSGGGCGCN